MRVARDAEDTYAGPLELGAPVTQELQFLRSGRRPVEEVEEQQGGAILEQLLELCFLAVVEPEHAPNLLDRQGAQHQPLIVGNDLERNCADTFETARICRRPTPRKTNWSASGEPTASHRPSGDRTG